LNDEDAVREGRAQIRGRHVNAVGLFTTVNAPAIADAEFLDEFVIAFATVDHVCVIALAGGYQIARAVLAVSDGQSLDVGEEAAVADRGDLCVIRSGLRLGPEFPDSDGLFGDIEMAQFVIGDTAFDHRAEFEVTDLLRVDLAVALEQFPLLDV